MASSGLQRLFGRKSILLLLRVTGACCMVLLNVFHSLVLCTFLSFFIVTNHGFVVQYCITSNSSMF